MATFEQSPLGFGIPETNPSRQACQCCAGLLSTGSGFGIPQEGHLVLDWMGNQVTMKSWSAYCQTQWRDSIVSSGARYPNLPLWHYEFVDLGNRCKQLCGFCVLLNIISYSSRQFLKLDLVKVSVFIFLWKFVNVGATKISISITLGGTTNLNYKMQNH